ncbi:MAG: hypothetical protein M3Y71_05925 [Actinomycetota bacterium]|nr:hypothetical protein [Actinomycetota bacterium]
MTAGVIDGTEEQALASGGGPEALLPGCPWQAYQLVDTLSAYAAALADTANTLARVEVTGWAGAASDTAHTRLGQEPSRWAAASTAFSAAAAALSRYADTFAPARALAAEAGRLYEQYLTSVTAIAQALAEAEVSVVARQGVASSPFSPSLHSGRGGIGERLALLVSADAHPATHDSVWPAEHLRRAAVDTLARARALLDVSGDDAAGALTRATSEAPRARTFWQGTIRPPGAEDTAHHGLDAASWVPGWVGATAALLNAGWFVVERRREDAAWAAAGAVPFAGKGLHTGLATRTALETAPEAVRVLAAVGARRIAEGHAWTKHVVAGGEFPQITTPEQFTRLIEDVLLHGEGRPSAIYPGKTYYWKDGTFVVIDPRNPDGGTAFRPHQGREYFEDQE